MAGIIVVWFKDKDGRIWKKDFSFQSHYLIMMKKKVQHTLPRIT